MNIHSRHRHRFKVMFNIAAICALSMTWFTTYTLSGHQGDGAKLSVVHKNAQHNPTEGMEDIVDGDAKLEQRRAKTAKAAKV